MSNSTLRSTLSAIAIIGAVVGTANAADVQSIQGRAAPVAGTSLNVVLIKGTPVAEVQGRAAPVVTIAVKGRFVSSKQDLRVIRDIVSAKYGRA